MKLINSLFLLLAICSCSIPHRINQLVKTDGNPRELPTLEILTPESCHQNSKFSAFSNDYSTLKYLEENGPKLSQMSLVDIANVIILSALNTNRFEVNPNSLLQIIYHQKNKTYFYRPPRGDLAIALDVFSNRFSGTSGLPKLIRLVDKASSSLMVNQTIEGKLKNSFKELAKLDGQEYTVLKSTLVEGEYLRPIKIKQSFNYKRRHRRKIVQATKKSIRVISDHNYCPIQDTENVNSNHFVLLLRRGDESLVATLSSPKFPKISHFRNSRLLIHDGEVTYPPTCLVAIGSESYVTLINTDQKSGPELIKQKVRELQTTTFSKWQDVLKGPRVLKLKKPQRTLVESDYFPPQEIDQLVSKHLGVTHQPAIGKLHSVYWSKSSNTPQLILDPRSTEGVAICK